MSEKGILIKDNFLGYVLFIQQNDIIHYESFTLKGIVNNIDLTVMYVENLQLFIDHYSLHEHVDLDINKLENKAYIKSLLGSLNISLN